MSGPGRTTKRGISWSSVCKLALRLPGVTEGTSYGTPALHVCKRFLARLKEDGETMAIKIDYAEREVLLELDPTAFYLTGRGGAARSSGVLGCDQADLVTPVAAGRLPPELK